MAISSAIIIKLFIFVNVFIDSVMTRPTYEEASSLWPDTNNDKFSSEFDPNLARWSNWAYRFIQNITCSQVILMPPDHCIRLQSTPTEKMNLYFAKHSKEGRYRIALSNGDVNRAGVHNSVLVIDPFPKDDYGHLVLVFFIDFGWTHFQCDLYGGIYMGNGECLTLALRNYCHNLIETALGLIRKRNFSKRCEINFLPVVHFDGEERPYDNQLQCINNINGFSKCPSLDNENEVDCDPIATNIAYANKCDDLRDG